MCVRVCEGACKKVQCVYKWCVRDCVYNGCVYRGCESLHRGGWCALHCVEWQECDKEIYVCRLDVCDKGVCSGWMCTGGVWGGHAVHPLHTPSHTHPHAPSTHTPSTHTPSHPPQKHPHTYPLYTHHL